MIDLNLMSIERRLVLTYTQCSVLDGFAKGDIIADITDLIEEVKRLQSHFEASQAALGETMGEVADLKELLCEAPSPEIANVPLGAHALPFTMIDILRDYLERHKDWYTKVQKLLEGKGE